jgi:hypothetical protein
MLGGVAAPSKVRAKAAPTAAILSRAIVSCGLVLRVLRVRACSQGGVDNDVGAGTAVDNRFQFGLFFGRNGKLIQRLLKIVKEGLRLARGTFQIGIPARRLALCEYSAGRHVIPKLGCPRLFASDAPAS